MLLRFERTIRESMSAIAGAAREIQLCSTSSGENDDTTRSASIHERGACKNGRFPRSILGVASNRPCGPMQLRETPCTDAQAWCGLREGAERKGLPLLLDWTLKDPLIYYFDMRGITLLCVANALA
jgi:hypothetical protein